MRKHTIAESFVDETLRQTHPKKRKQWKHQEYKRQYSNAMKRIVRIISNTEIYGCHELQKSDISMKMVGNCDDQEAQVFQATVKGKVQIVKLHLFFKCFYLFCIVHQVSFA